jgi:hypothetical protein
MASQEKIDRAPSAETLIQWDLKIGLYKLERPKPPGGGWIWMADHVIRLGVYKCFVIVGVRMATLMAKKDLTIALEDLEEEMTSGAVQTKKALSLSKFAKFAPPQQRSKARYMNLDSLVKWGCTMLNEYVTLPEEVQRKVSWLMPLKREIRKWQGWVQIGQVTRDLIRREGFYDGADEVLMDKLIKIGLTSEETEEFTEELVDYVRSEGEGIHRDNRLVGTTEVLEGLFGGYKRMVGENKMSLNGLGRLILCMSSRIGEFSEELVHKAMTNVKCKDIDAWLDRAFMKNDKKILEQNQEQLCREEACNF